MVGLKWTMDNEVCWLGRKSVKFKEVEVQQGSEVVQSHFPTGHQASSTLPSHVMSVYSCQLFLLPLTLHHATQPSYLHLTVFLPHFSCSFIPLLVSNCCPIVNWFLFFAFVYAWPLPGEPCQSNCCICDLALPSWLEWGSDRQFGDLLENSITNEMSCQIFAWRDGVRMDFQPFSAFTFLPTVKAWESIHHFGNT